MEYWTKYLRQQQNKELFFNVLISENNKTKVLLDYQYLNMVISLNHLIESLCLSNGSTLCGHLRASKIILVKQRKLPIYLAKFNDCLIPIRNNQKILWFSFKRFLTCYQIEEYTLIRFKDGCEIIVPCSKECVMIQYKKALFLYNSYLRLRNESHINEMRCDNVNMADYYN